MRLLVVGIAWYSSVCSVITWFISIIHPPPSLLLFPSSLRCISLAYNPVAISRFSTRMTCLNNCLHLHGPQHLLLLHFDAFSNSVNLGSSSSWRNVKRSRTSNLNLLRVLLSTCQLSFCFLISRTSTYKQIPFSRCCFRQIVFRK